MDMVPVKDPSTGLISFYAENVPVVINAAKALEMATEVVMVERAVTSQNAPDSKDDVAGYDYDPYGVSDASGYNQYTDIHSPYIPFHNYRQIHVAMDGAYKGYNSARPLPAVPPLWGDMGHYWNFGVFVGYGTYELIRVFGGIIVAAITVYAASKGIVA